MEHTQPDREATELSFDEKQWFWHLMLGAFPPHDRDEVNRIHDEFEKKGL